MCWFHGKHEQSEFSQFPHCDIVGDWTVLYYDYNDDVGGYNIGSRFRFKLFVHFLEQIKCENLTWRTREIVKEWSLAINIVVWLTLKTCDFKICRVPTYNLTLSFCLGKLKILIKDNDSGELFEEDLIIHFKVLKLLVWYDLMFNN